MVSLTPSGTAAVTEDKLRALKEAGLVRLAVSLDGAGADAHDAFRRVRGSYRNTLRIIERARALGLGLQINTTVCHQTVEESNCRAVVPIRGSPLGSLPHSGRSRKADQCLAADEIGGLRWAANLQPRSPSGSRRRMPRSITACSGNGRDGRGSAGPSLRLNECPRPGGVAGPVLGPRYEEPLTPAAPSPRQRLVSSLTRQHLPDRSCGCRLHVRRDDLVGSPRPSALRLAADPAARGPVRRCGWRRALWRSRAGLRPHAPAGGRSGRVLIRRPGVGNDHRSAMSEALRGVFDPELGMSVLDLG